MPTCAARFCAVLILTAALGLAQQESPRDKKKDPEAIGDRNVAGSVNWYSLEKEIALKLASQ